MSPAAMANFINYETPQYDFSVGNSLYNFQPVQQSFTLPAVTYTPPVIDFTPIQQTIQPVIQTVASVAKKTISFTVSDSDGTLPGANIAVDGIGKAQTDGNGRVTLSGILPTSIIKISYVGYADYVISAETLPANVIMKEEATPLEQVNITAWKKPVKPNNNWGWWLATAVAAFGIYKMKNSGTKIVHAKL